MSSTTRSFDEPAALSGDYGASERRSAGYANVGAESSSSVGSSILGSTGGGDQPVAGEEAVEERKVEIKIDMAGEWDGINIAPLLAVAGMQDVESIKLVVCKMNERACHRTEHPRRVISWAVFAMTLDSRCSPSAQSAILKDLFSGVYRLPWFQRFMY
ncbi:hypothetical protein LR48_Vigan03g099700 [Vigna angularis]|uniref:Uncharacterized protein n=1 Tax=Phaseolus angularis TaxID=3914 RepID=A0A0L9U4A2_PHAAN|nr:hypothetical protein LR48_Vigan03g099700 [Vigna angularis]